MSVLIKVCAIALIGCAAALILAQMQGSLAFGVKIASVVIIFSTLLVSMRPVLDAIAPFADENPKLTEYASIVIRALGVAILAALTAGVCRDCGQSSIALGVETVAKVEILLLCLPLISDICDCAVQILNMS